MASEDRSDPQRGLRGVSGGGVSGGMTQPTPPGPSSSQPAKRRSHLIDPQAPREPYDAEAEARLLRVQQWIMSTLAVTTILHLAVGLVIGAVTLDDPAPGARVGLNIIAGILAVLAVVLARAIHRRRILSWWLLTGTIPAVVGLWITFA